MLKNYFAFSLLLLISLNILSQGTISENNIDRCKHENCYKDQIEKIISLILPEGSQIESIEKSEFPGIYKVYFGDLQIHKLAANHQNKLYKCLEILIFQ